MRIVLAGGTGFIGRHLLRTLLEGGHEVTALHRGACPSFAHPALRWIAGRWAAGGFPPALFAEGEAAVNAVGLLKEGGGDTYAGAHVHGTLAFFEAARAAGCRRLVHVSALGADPAAPQPFLATKGDADRRLLEGEDVVVLRPSVVYGPGDFSMATLARAADLPWVPLPAGGVMLLQPLWVGDLAEAALRALEADPFPAGIHDLGGPEALPLREILALLKGSAPRFLPIPAGAMALIAALGGWVGHSLLNLQTWSLLQAGSTCDSEPLRRLLGREALAFREGVALRSGRA